MDWSGKRSMGKQRAAAAISVAAVAAGVSAAPVGATNWAGIPAAFVGTCFGRGVADNREHTFFYENLEAPMVAAANDHRGYMDGVPLVITTKMVPQANTTDANLIDQNYTTYCGLAWHGSGGGTVGLTSLLLPTAPTSASATTYGSTPARTPWGPHLCGTWHATRSATASA